MARHFAIKRVAGWADYGRGGPVIHTPGKYNRLPGYTVIAHPDMKSRIFPGMI